jgi:hypothetical protein
VKRIRKLGLLTLVAVALTTTAGVATASAAGGFQAAEYPAVVDGTQAGVFGSLRSNLSEWRCDGFEMADELDLETRNLAPEVGNSNCTRLSGTVLTGPLAISMNSCGFEFSPGDEGEGVGAVSIGPAGCGAITVDFTEKDCIWSFAPQDLVATYENVETGLLGTEGVKVNVPNDHLDHTASGSWIWCKSGTNLTLEMDWLLSATNAAAEPIDLTVSDELPDTTGVFLAGKASEKEAEKPRLEANEYPVSLAGVPDAEDPLTVGTKSAFTLHCDDAAYPGNTVSGPTKVISLSGVETEACTATLFGVTRPAALVTNSCTYDLNILNSGPPYTGSMNIKCTAESEVVTIYIFNTNFTERCRYTIGPHSGLTGIGFANTGEGFFDQSVLADFNKVAITVKKSFGTVLQCGGTTHEGWFDGKLEVFGTV